MVIFICFNFRFVIIHYHKTAYLFYENFITHCITWQYNSVQIIQMIGRIRYLVKNAENFIRPEYQGIMQFLQN